MSAVVATTLGKRYGQRWGLRDCSVEIPEGRIVALVGPNGAGKTTLLHLVVGLLEPSAGRVLTLGGPPGRTRIYCHGWASLRRTSPCTGRSASARCSSSVGA